MDSQFYGISAEAQGLYDGFHGESESFRQHTIGADVLGHSWSHGYIRMNAIVLAKAESL
jgi:hypothetical protein